MVHYYNIFYKKSFFPVIILSLLLIIVLSGCSNIKSSSYTVGGVSFTMSYVPGGLTFPTDYDDVTMINSDNDETIDPPNTRPSAPGSTNIKITVKNAYWIAQTDVTYELWSAVYNWANNHGYIFNSIGAIGGGRNIDESNSGGSNQQPVTNMNWRDAMIWCNALTEFYYGNSSNCIYYSDANFTTPIRRADYERVDTTPGTEDNPYVKTTAKGFRLPTNNEWELAARYKDGTNWTPGSYASGATDYAYNNSQNPNQAPTHAVAVYGTDNTAVVKSKAPNALNLYDMSGNVDQWCFDWYPGDTRMTTYPQYGPTRVLRGGSWRGHDMLLGFLSYFGPAYSHTYWGFRPVRNP